MPTLFDPTRRDALLARARRLRVDTPARWGELSAGRMVCHVTDAMLCGCGELEAAPRPGAMARWPLNRLVIHVLPWPRGKAHSPPEFIARAGDSWDEDLARLGATLERFAALGPRASFPPSPVFGSISGKDWGVLAWRHADHHLTQFGV